VVPSFAPFYNVVPSFGRQHWCGPRLMQGRTSLVFLNRNLTAPLPPPPPPRQVRSLGPYQCYHHAPTLYSRRNFRKETLDLFPNMRSSTRAAAHTLQHTRSDHTLEALTHTHTHARTETVGARLDFFFVSLIQHASLKTTPDA
jgi:hypothetical protein